MGLLKRLFGSPESGQPEPDEVELRGNGAFDLEIKGESHYQGNIARAVKAAQGARLLTATLIPEDSNSYDRNAVRVDIDGRTVGYLSREVAPIYRKQLKISGHPRAAATCQAKIAGGSEDKPKYGVWLDIPAEEE